MTAPRGRFDLLSDATESADVLLRRPRTLEPETRAAEAVRLFTDDPELRSLPVVDIDDRPVGVLHRYALLSHFATPYGHSLYGNRPVSELVSADAVTVHEATTLESLSERITDRAGVRAHEDFVIVDDHGRYRGVGTVLDLLRRITDLRIRSARHANPLTGLPGNVPFDRCLDRLIEAGRDFVALYCDLDHFKGYNDRYGYAEGDRVIGFLAGLLREHLGTDDAFLAHIGGDDFAVACRMADWRARCDALVHAFDAGIAACYGAADRARGGVAGVDRCGRSVFPPLIALSVAAVPVVRAGDDNRHAVASRLAEVKAAAKAQPGSVVRVDRRRGEASSTA